MSSRLITAINKDPREDRHDRIRRFGGIFLDGGLLDFNRQWQASFDEAIAMAQAGVKFFVLSSDGKARIPVQLHTSPYGNLCLQSDSNGLLGDNLLSLPELPAENALARALMDSGKLNALANPPKGYGVGLINTSTNRLAALAAGLKSK